MKAALRFSLAMNLLLVGVILWFMTIRKDGQEQVDSPVRLVARQRPDGMSQLVVRSAPEPFQWSQIESADYQVYIANLRRIGCPEQTVRDIIVADVHGVYASRLAYFQSRGKETGAEHLRREEVAIVDTLLGPEKPALLSGLVSRRRVELERIVEPLVFESTDSQFGSLTEQQADVFKELRERFAQQVGVATDPRDPGYRERWVTAQRNSDELLEALLGSEFFLEHQLHAAAESQNP